MWYVGKENCNPVPELMPLAEDEGGRYDSLALAIDSLLHHIGGVREFGAGSHPTRKANDRELAAIDVNLAPSPAPSQAVAE